MSFIYLFYSCFQLNEILVVVCTTIYAGIIYVTENKLQSTIKITNLDEWQGNYFIRKGSNSNLPCECRTTFIVRQH